MVEERTEICKRCPICDTNNWICNAKLYLNPTSGEINVTPKEGFIKGCGCLLSRKIPDKTKHCPAKKW